MAALEFKVASIVYVCIYLPLCASRMRHKVSF